MSKELHAKPAAELRAELIKLRKEQFALRLQRATGQAIKPDQFGKVRKSVARIKTVLRAQEIGLATGQKIDQKAGKKPVEKAATKTVKKTVKKAGGK
jgi:large subunit ribosomal protein L29